jgi:dTDP-4-dehydrorhamnose reductase
VTKVIVTGASGMLGRALMRELSEYNPIGLAFNRPKPGLQPLNLLDQQATVDFLSFNQPDVIIHAAAERRPDIGEKDPEGTRALNVDSTSVIAQSAKKLGSWVLYMSTDYVFDGTTPPYKPEDRTNPLNLYGKTKLEGEQALLSETNDAAILRLGVLFGRVEFIDESAVTTILKDVRNPEEKAVDDWGQRYPIFVDDVAFICHQMVQRRIAEGTMAGIWHWCGNERYTKYGQAIVMGEILHIPTSHLRPDPDPPAGAPRPRDCQLDVSKLENLGLGRHTPFREALEISFRESNLG